MTKRLAPFKSPATAPRALSVAPAPADEAKVRAFLNETTGTKETKRMNIAVPVDLHRELRIAAAHKDLSLTDAVNDAIRLWVEQQKRTAEKLGR